MRSFVSLFLAATVVGIVPFPFQFGTPKLHGEEKAVEGEEFFEQHIRPVLVQHCYECHSSNAKNVKGGLLLDSQSAAQAGGDSGPAVVPKDVEGSLLISALRYEDFEMPPKGKLPETVIANFVKWIEMGAADPRGGDTQAVSSIDFVEGRKHWAYQPIASPQPPAVARADWPLGPIDHFTLAKMESLGLAPVEPATKQELIRRATFDLTGLPPTPADVASFLADGSNDAFEKVIDRLLESERYGERWGRHWLDVARYSEDQAHTFSVTQNTNGFRYRDWVISAFNSDMPYDKFVRLQIAGDLIGPDTEGSYDHLVALGFFGLGAQYYKNTDKEKAAADELDDRVDTLTRGFLGLTVSCARCHDHKFDPIPTQDYYSLAGIFRSSKLHNAPLCTEVDVQTYTSGQERVKQADEALKKFLADRKSTAAAEKVGEITRYMETVWSFQSAKANGVALTTAKSAEDAGLNEFLLKRWIDFLAPNRRGKIGALEPWFELETPQADTSSPVAIPLPVTKVAQEFQQRIQRLIDVRDGVATANLVETEKGKPHEPGSPRFVTPLVTKVRPIAGIDVDIRGARQLFLVVADGGNGKACDHADWLQPRLSGPNGELMLTTVPWKKLDGFAGGKIDKNYTGSPLRVGGKSYENGIGVHAPTVIVYDIPAGYDRFLAIGGLDNSGSDQGGCGEQASIQFSVYTEEPVDGPVGIGTDLLTLILGTDGPFTVSDEDLEEFLSGDAKQQLIAFRQEAKVAKESAPPMYAIAHSYREDRSEDMRVFVRGDPARARELAPRRFLKVLAGDNPPHYTTGSGRLELADAIANEDNPLTARVMANRVWQHHFGRGIVATPSNFGKLGEPPTHPGLLDHLAHRLLQSGGSIKSLHREIMRSATYQLGSASSESNANIDGDNRFLWHMSRRRLDVEAWRDSLLDVSGRLDRSMGGPSTNLGDPNNVRRTVYAKISRHELDSLLRLFDFPDANITSSTRTETTVPQQQLFVLNSAFMVGQAKSFATRIHQEEPANDEARIAHAFLLAYGRPATDVELELGLAYLASEKDPESKLSRWESYAQILLGSNEFIYID